MGTIKNLKKYYTDRGDFEQKFHYFVADNLKFCILQSESDPSDYADYLRADQYCNKRLYARIMLESQTHGHNRTYREAI